MPLTDQEKKVIREEEFFRAEVRKEIAAKKTPSFGLKVSAFFETKTGFWLLTTVLAGVIATGMTKLERYFNQEEIAKKENAEQARRDTEMLLKLGPMLTSESQSQVGMAIVLLDGLALGKAVNEGVVSQIKALVQNTLSVGLKPDATKEQKAQAVAILAFADKPQLDANQSDTSPSAVAAPAGAIAMAIDNTALPIRVYIQVNSETDKPMASATANQLRKNDLIVPGIELVPARNSPAVNSIRYCEGKVAADAAERVRNASAETVKPAPILVKLDPRLCGKVRFNHFELWYARK